MNSATIRRGGPRGGGRGGRTTSAPRGGRRPVKRTTWLDKAIAAIPLSPERLSRLVSWAIAGLIAAILWVIAQFLGLPAMVGQEASHLAAKAGFQVAQVKVIGLERMDEMPVYNIALGEMDRSMLALDLPELRRRIMTIGWVEDARISRRLPDTLVVDIVERQPVAIWQHGGKLSLIDVNGIVLTGVEPRAIPDLPLVVGPQANLKTRALGDLMEAAPALKPMLAGATWVGNRRWDLRFQSGETLSLPEGQAEASAALVNFARMDGVDRLLGRGIVRFDMRDPAKFVLRLPSDRPGGGDVVTKPAGEGTTGGGATAPATASKPADDDEMAAPKAAPAKTEKKEG